MKSILKPFYRRPQLALWPSPQTYLITAHIYLILINEITLHYFTQSGVSSHDWLLTGVRDICNSLITVYYFYSSGYYETVFHKNDARWPRMRMTFKLITPRQRPNSRRETINDSKMPKQAMHMSPRNKSRQSFFTQALHFVLNVVPNDFSVLRGNLPFQPEVHHTKRNNRIMTLYILFNWMSP